MDGWRSEERLRMEFMAQICELRAERIFEDGLRWCVQAMCNYEKSTTTIQNQMRGICAA
jgi:hypothetical protein